MHSLSMAWLGYYEKPQNQINKLKYKPQYISKLTNSENNNKIMKDVNLQVIQLFFQK